jgi:hypothetical protein
LPGSCERPDWPLSPGPYKPPGLRDRACQPSSISGGRHSPICSLVFPRLLVLAAVLLAITLATSGCSSNSNEPPHPPAVSRIPRGATPLQQARNIGAWIRRYSR